MKKHTFLLIFIATLFGTSCKKNHTKVIHNCTGSYLQIDGDHYLICNKDIVKDYENGAKVTANFNNITWDDCNQTWAACLMHFAHEGVIQIKSISER